MKAVHDACKEAGLKVPNEVQSFFGYCEPDEHGEKIDLEKIRAAVEWNDGQSSSGYKVDIKKLPHDVEWIIFYNSW